MNQDEQIHEKYINSWNLVHVNCVNNVYNLVIKRLESQSHNSSLYTQKPTTFGVATPATYSRKRLKKWTNRNEIYLILLHYTLHVSHVITATPGNGNGKHRKLTL